jgi:hypothetical protein
MKYEGSECGKAHVLVLQIMPDYRLVTTQTTNGLSRTECGMFRRAEAATEQNVVQYL